MSCDLLREGAPIEPVPNVTHWKPDAVVREATPTLPLERADSSVLAYPCLDNSLLPMCLCRCPVKCLFRLTAADVSQYISALSQEWVIGRVNIQNANV